MTKRYSVHQDKSNAMRLGPYLASWDEAKVEHDRLFNPIANRIWHHNDDGTVTDVTDGDVEMQWWFCEWGKHKGFTSGEALPIRPLTVTMSWRDGEVNNAYCCIQSATAPTAEQFQAHILAETGVEVPCVEKPRWWFRHSAGQWVNSDQSVPHVNIYEEGKWQCRVFATESTRDAKAKALCEAAKAAGEDGAA